MRIDTVEREGVACLHLRDGDALDVSTAPGVKVAALAALERGRDVVVDLSRIDFLDSAGVGVVVALVKTARSRGLRARFAGLSATARATLGLIRLDAIIDFSTDVDAAVKACRRRRDAEVG